MILINKHNNDTGAYQRQSLLISRKLNKPVHPPLLMDNQVITEVDSHKYLGVFLTNDCTWHKQIDNKYLY